jgi:hypothetical protein
LGIAEIGGASETDPTVKPWLGLDPLERGQAIGSLIGKGIELPAGALGAAAGLDDDMKAAFGIGFGNAGASGA